MALDPEALAKLAALASSGELGAKQSSTIHNKEGEGSLPTNEEASDEGAQHDLDSTDVKSGHTCRTSEDGTLQAVPYTRSDDTSQHTGVNDDPAQVIHHAIASETGCNDIDNSMGLESDLDCDALSLWSIVSSCEQQLGVTVPDKDVYHADTVGELIALFEKTANN